MMEDCIKYVLNDPYPSPVIDIDEYVTRLGETTFDRSAVAVENALGDLPEIYQSDLVNRLLTTYTHTASSSTLRSNIEVVLPVLWRILPKEVRVQVVRRVDQIISNGDSAATEQAFAFVQVADAMPYLSANARRYRVEPLVHSLRDSLDKWSEEDRLVRELLPFATIIPPDLMATYVAAIVKTYVGQTGSSMQYSRSDFYANGAALVIPDMVELFDDRAAEAFVNVVRTDEVLKSRIKRPSKLRRLRRLAGIVRDRVSDRFQERAFLDKLLDDTSEDAFWAELGRRTPT
jgi:hypothetical protein